MIALMMLLASFFTLLKSPDHAIYLSLTEIELKESSATISIKVFSDDLQDALRNHSTRYQPGDLISYFDLNQKLGEVYFQEQLTLTADGKKLDLKLVNYTIEGDAHFVNLSAELPQQMSTMELNASFLMELFPTQTNVVKITQGETVEYLKFTNPVEAQTITYQH